MTFPAKHTGNSPSFLVTPGTSAVSGAVAGVPLACVGPCKPWWLSQQHLPFPGFHQLRAPHPQSRVFSSIPFLVDCSLRTQCFLSFDSDPLLSDAHSSPSKAGPSLWGMVRRSSSLPRLDKTHVTPVLCSGFAREDCGVGRGTGEERQLGTLRSADFPLPRCSFTSCCRCSSGRKRRVRNRTALMVSVLCKDFSLYRELCHFENQASR